MATVSSAESRSTRHESGSTRQGRALRNDARILDAAEEIAVVEGWLGLAPTRVAAASGLSRSTVQERYRTRAEVGRALWVQRCGPALQAALLDLLAAGGLDPGGGGGLSLRLAELAAPPRRLLAAAELLVVAHYVPEITAAVAHSVGPVVHTRCAMGSPADRARRAYLLMTGLGLVLGARRTDAGRFDWTHVGSALAEALTHPTQPVDLPTSTALHLAGDLDLAPDDPALNALLNATLREVGTRGFEGASVDRIARAAHHTKGLVFSRFPSKLELFLEATRRQQSLAFAANNAFLSEIARDHGRGIAEAVALREMQDHHLGYGRAIALEQLRLSWHNREVKAAHETDVDAAVDAIAGATLDLYWHDIVIIHFAYAMGLGLAALPLLYPPACTLAYDVMTVPLVELGL